MTPDEEREAEAYMVWRRYGERAPAHVAERIREMTADADVAGIERWSEISAKLDGLMQGPRQ